MSGAINSLPLPPLLWFCWDLNSCIKELSLSHVSLQSMKWGKSRQDSRSKQQLHIWSIREVLFDSGFLLYIILDQFFPTFMTHDIWYLCYIFNLTCLICLVSTCCYASNRGLNEEEISDVQNINKFNISERKGPITPVQIDCAQRCSEIQNSWTGNKLVSLLSNGNWNQ